MGLDKVDRERVLNFLDNVLTNIYHVQIPEWDKDQSELDYVIDVVSRMKGRG